MKNDDLNPDPKPGELWTDPNVDEWHVLADDTGRPWLARPVEGADLTGWRLASDLDPQSDPAWHISPNDVPAAVAQLMRGGKASILPHPADRGITATYPVTDADGSAGVERFHISPLGLAMLAEARASRAARDVHVVRDGDDVHALCPSCGAIDRIAELDEDARINPISFSEGVDNDGLYFTIATSHPDAGTQRYICRACRATVTISPDITFIA